MYASWGAYANHIENKYLDKHQTFTPVTCRETDIPQNTETYLEQSGEQSGGGLTYKGEGSYGGIPEYDQDLDEDFQPVEQDDIQEPELEVEQDEVEELGNDSDVEPIPETTATPPPMDIHIPLTSLGDFPTDIRLDSLYMTIHLSISARPNSITSIYF
ncbi:hypothetical protein BGX38DRAFT_1275375 [Terfezia claveryi]|nr:hypothetical protein BGX38DRAFT_1275375 [Terfezia claveryi]